ncbi:MAG: DUF2298 domain-containing protein [Halodesulfurarchaeum sp.]
MEFHLVLLWFALYVGLGLLSLPATSLLFDRLPDGGAGLSFTLSFAVLAFVGFWIGHISFGGVAALGGIVLLGLGSWIAISRGLEVQTRRFLDVAIIFAAAFALLVTIRAFKPGIWPGGGEKFLDFGLLASLLRASHLPPEDMWFANEPVQYYYGGHMLAALFATLTGTAARYAYNLALPGFYAAYVATAYALAGNIAASRGHSYRGAGLAGAFLVGIASNLSTPLRVIVWVLPDGADSALASLVSLEEAGLALGPRHFDYWMASRVIDWRVINGDQWHLINEFPFFAFLNGDLHAHMMGPVFLLLGVAIAFTYWVTPTERRVKRLLLVLGVFPPVVGLLVVVNTWSVPTLLGILWLTIFFAPASPATLFPKALAGPFETQADHPWWRREIKRGSAATVLTLGAGVMAAISVLPFLLGPASGRGIGVLPHPRSDLAGLLIVHGAFLLISLAFLWRQVSDNQRLPVATGLVAFLSLTWFLRAPAVGLFLPIILGGWYLLRTRVGVTYETVLLVGVAGLALLVEFAYVIEQAGPGRYNTVFKVYAQVWALWAVAAASMLPSLLNPRRVHDDLLQSRGTKDREPISEGPGTGDDIGLESRRSGSGSNVDTREKDKPGRSNALRTLRTVAVVLLLASLAIYAPLGLGWAVTTGRDEPTLDGHAFIEEQHPGEAPAIEWLSRREGQPTLVSAPGTEIYQWVNAPSSLTGIPTLAGWIHEVGYRGRAPYFDRVQDVRIIYGTTDAPSRAALLRRYDVEYIYVGPIERERYNVQNYASEPGISVAFDERAVTIYRVDQDALAG